MGNRIFIVVETAPEGYRTKVEDNLNASAWVNMDAAYPEPVVEVLRHAMASNPTVRGIIEAGAEHNTPAFLDGQPVRLSDLLDEMDVMGRAAELETSLPPASVSTQKPRF